MSNSSERSITSIEENTDGESQMNDILKKIEDKIKNGNMLDIGKKKTAEKKAIDT